MEFLEKMMTLDIGYFKGLVTTPTGGLSLWVTLFLIVSFISTISYALMTFPRKARILRQHFPSVFKFPLLGSIPFILGPPDDLATGIERGIEELGRMYTFWLGHSPYLVISDADAVQKVLSSTKYIEKGRSYDQFHWLFGSGLITSNGQLWRDDRRLLSPSFKYQRFDGFLHSFNKNSKVLVDILEDVFKDGKNKGINLHPYLCRATMDFINESALGQVSNFQHDIHAKFLEAVHMALNSFRTRLTRPWLTLPIIWDIFGCGKQEKVVLSIIKDIIAESIEKRNKILSKAGEDGSVSGTKPFIDALLDSKSESEISGHIVTIFGAGFETTASGMNYTLFLLALHPHIQDKVHAELDSVLGGDVNADDLDVDVTFAHLAELKYLEMCIKEALRMFPPAPAILRHAVEDIQLDSGAVIPKGVDMLFLIREVHRDPTHFPSPEEFNPDRFLPEDCATRHPYAYIPFSSGPRNCLGLKYAMVQMKACLAHILRHFRVSTLQKMEDLKMVYGMVLEPHPAIQLSLSPRTNTNKK